MAGVGLGRQTWNWGSKPVAPDFSHCWLQWRAVMGASTSFSAGFNILMKVFLFFFNLRNMIIKLCSIVCPPHVIKSTCLHCLQCWLLRWSFYPITCQLACVARFNDNLPDPRFSSCRAKLLQWWIKSQPSHSQFLHDYKLWLVVDKRWIIIWLSGYVIFMRP